MRFVWILSISLFQHCVEVFWARVREWFKLVIDCLRETPPGKGFPLPKTHVPKWIEMIEIGKSLIVNTKISWVGETDSQCKNASGWFDCRGLYAASLQGGIQQKFCHVIAPHRPQLMRILPTWLFAAICPGATSPTQRSLLRDNCGSLLIIDDIPFWTVIILGVFFGGFGRISMKDETGKLFFPLLLFPSGGTRSQKRHISVCLGVDGVFSCFFHGHVPHSWWPPPWYGPTTHTTSTIYSI